jgi:hypothetical protein
MKRDPKERAAELFAQWEKGFNSNPEYRKRVMKAVKAVKKQKWFRGEPCVGCGHPATVVNQDSLCKKCIANQ